MKKIIIPLMIVAAVILYLGMESEPATELSTYTLQQVSEHSESSDCWMAINGKVYDATQYINSHPGGNSITQGCGKDATELFETRPMGSGTPHSGAARYKLNDFLIGNLQER